MKFDGLSRGDQVWLKGTGPAVVEAVFYTSKGCNLILSTQHDGQLELSEADNELITAATQTQEVTP